MIQEENNVSKLHLIYLERCDQELRKILVKITK
jgi:hypothetical protein